MCHPSLEISHTRSGRPRFIAGGAFHSACGSRQFEEAGVDAARTDARRSKCAPIHINAQQDALL